MDRLLLKGVVVRKLNDELCTETSWENCSLTALPQDEACLLQVKLGDQVVVDTVLEDGGDIFRVGGGKSVLIKSSNHGDVSSVLLILSNSEEATQLWILLAKICQQKQRLEKSDFDRRTDEASAQQYFQWYGHFWQQQNMLQDYVRTATYQSAFLQNSEMFKDKMVLDVGAGSGILSFFAIQAGAHHVYAVDASNITVHCQQLVNSNGLANQITVIKGRIEEVTLPEKVDLLISEPIGYMLYNERMVESYLHAKKWLKPGGRMMPTQGDLYIAPFTDEMLYLEQTNKAQFWQQKSFYSLDLSSLKETVRLEYLSQPIKDTFDPRILMAKPFKFPTNFETAHESDLYKFEFPLDFELTRTGIIHGLAFWFEIGFMGTNATVWLSTAPHQPPTHWHQIRCLLRTPLLGQKGEHLKGTVILNANERMSYDMDMQVSIGVGSDKKSSSNVLDLKNPYFRFASVAPATPPGCHSDNPTDKLYNNKNDQDPETLPPMKYDLTMNPSFSGVTSHSSSSK